MRKLPFYQVDVFTDRPFAGNPLAVFPDAEGLTAVQMQAIASEMNLSETTFVLPPEGGGDARVRIFTPALELPFAGHPSVGTACELVRLAPRRRVSAGHARRSLELGVGPDHRRGRRPRRRAGRGDRAPAAAGVPRPGAARLGRRRPRPGPRRTCTRNSTPCRSTPASATRSSRSSRSGRSRGSPSTSSSPATSSAATPRSTRAPSRGRTSLGWRRAACSRSPASPRTRPPAAPPGRSPPTWRARACWRPTRSASCSRAQQIGRPSFLTVAVSGTPTAITDVRVGGSVQPVLRGELSLPD